MRTLVTSLRRRTRDERGQVIVVLVIGMVVMLSMAALLLDAAQAVVLQRRLQGAADAAAVAAASQLQSGTPLGCSTNGTSATSPRSTISTAAGGSTGTNLAGVSQLTVTVTCPMTEPDPNEKVRVAVSAKAPTFFLGALGVFGASSSGFTVTAQATARYARSEIGKYSIIALEKTACQGGAFSGGPTIILGGSFQVNSPCNGTNSSSVALYNGGNPTVTLLNGSIIRTNGAYLGDPLNPPVRTGQPVVADPLAALPPITASSPTALTVRSTSKVTCKLAGSVTSCIGSDGGILLPGIYQGGIALQGQAYVFMRPGIYRIEGGGIDVGTATLCTVDETPAVALTQTTCQKAFSGESTTVVTNRWKAACATTCGVLIYNTAKTTSPTVNMGNIEMRGGANFLMKQFQPTTAAEEPYRNLVIWQDGTVSPQAEVWMRGGGALQVVGTVYSPLGVLDFGGNSDAAGPAQMTMQVIANKVSVQGNAGFNFVFDPNQFAQFYSFGLIE